MRANNLQKGEKKGQKNKKKTVFGKVRKAGKTTELDNERERDT